MSYPKNGGSKPELKLCEHAEPTGFCFVCTVRTPSRPEDGVKTRERPGCDPNHPDDPTPLDKHSSIAGLGSRTGALARARAHDTVARRAPACAPQMCFHGGSEQEGSHALAACTPAKHSGHAFRARTPCLLMAASRMRPRMAEITSPAEKLPAAGSGKLPPAIPASSSVAEKMPGNCRTTVPGAEIGPSSTSPGRFGPPFGRCWPGVASMGQVRPRSIDAGRISDEFDQHRPKNQSVTQIGLGPKFAGIVGGNFLEPVASICSASSG